MKRTYWSLNPKIQHYLTLSHLFFKQELTPKAPNPTPSFSLFSTFPQFQLYYQWTSQTSSLAICELHPYQMDHQISSLQTTIRMRSTALLETSCGYLLQELQARVFFFYFYRNYLRTKVISWNVSHSLFLYQKFETDDMGWSWRRSIWKREGSARFRTGLSRGLQEKSWQCKYIESSPASGVGRSWSWIYPSSFVPWWTISPWPGTTYQLM